MIGPVKDLEHVIADRLRARRRALGMTQAQLAEAAGVSAELVSRIERARCLPSVGSLVAFAEALATTPNDLLGFAEERPPTDVESLWSLLASLPADRRAEVRRVAEALVHYARRSDG